MRPVRRMLITVAAPLIVAAGVAVILGVRKGSAMIQQVEAWSDSLAYSHGPVELRVGGVPIFSNMYVDGDKIGKMDRIVVMRDRPGAVDSLQIVVSVENSEEVAWLSECHIHVDPEQLEENPFDGWKRMMHCVSDSDGLVSFGSVVFDGTNRSAVLLVEPGLIPCESRSGHHDCLDTREFRRDMVHLRDEIRREFRHGANKVRVRTN